MKTLVIFYSYSGHTKAIARNIATKESADIVEIKAKKQFGKLKAYTVGCFASMRGKAWEIQPLKKDLSAYDRFILLSPVWASNPAPAFNAILKQLPGDKPIAVKMVSMSGKSNCKERLEKIIKTKGNNLESFEDIRQ